MILVLIATVFQTPALTQGVKFQTFPSWDEVVKKSKTDNKYILVDCYATWCIPCKRMDKEVFTKNEIGDFINSKFISVKVQMDKTQIDGDLIKSWYKEVQRFQTAYSINAYPTYLVFDSKEMLYISLLGLWTLISLCLKS